MVWEEFVRLWPSYIIAGNVIMLWMMASLRRRFMTREDFDKLERTVSDKIGDVSSEVGKVSGRLSLAERDMAHLPSMAALQETNIRLERLLGAMEAAKSDYRHVFDRQTRLEDAYVRHDQILADAARTSRAA